MFGAYNLNSFLTSNSNCKVKLLQLDTNSPDNNYSSDPFTFHASSLCSHIWSDSNHVSFEIPEILNIVFRSSCLFQNQFTMSYLRQKSTNNVAENMIKLHIFNITYLWGTKKVPQSKCANKNRPCVSPRISNFCWNFLPGLAWKVVSIMIRQDSLSHWTQNLNWDVEK